MVVRVRNSLSTLGPSSFWGVRIWAQHGSAAKAVFSLGAFLPDKEHGSGIGDCIDGGGIVLKRIRADPAGEIVRVSPTGPSQVEFNVERLA